MLSWIRKACQTTGTLCGEWRQRGVFVDCRRATWLRDFVRICPFFLQIHPLQKSRRCARGLPEDHLSRVVFRVVRVVFKTSCQMAGGGRVSLYGQPVRQRMTGTANKEDECPRRTTAFRDDAGSRRGARRNGMTAGFNAFSRLPRSSVSAKVGSAVPLRGAIPGAVADNRFAPANPIVSRKSGQFPHSGHWLRGAYLRTSLLIFGTGLSRASLKNNGEAFHWPTSPPKTTWKTKQR